jgi:hypothetical protein
MHPDVVSLVHRYGRVHHHVDLDAIVNKHRQPARLNSLIVKSDVKLINKVDNYGMKLIREWGTPEAYEDATYSADVYPRGRKNL